MQVLGWRYHEVLPSSQLWVSLVTNTRPKACQPSSVSVSYIVKGPEVVQCAEHEASLERGANGACRHCSMKYISRDLAIDSF